MIKAMVTGGSKGLGAAIVTHLIDRDIEVTDVSRSGNSSMKGNQFYKHQQVDMTSLSESLNFLRSWTEEQKDLTKLYLIQNAGTVQPMETVGNMDPSAIETAIALNYTAPAAWANLAFRLADEIGFELVIVNITSGAADKPNHGWSVYGSTKAALNLFTETAALEQGDEGHTIISYSPSIMDTGMQEEIRSTDAASFAAVETFQQYKEQGKLRKPEDVAGVLVNILLKEKLVNGKLYHVNDYLPSTK
ncbi:SDR family NAD(P)-dependent oxidoreductase [Jeotgalibacillus haloalkalitolerans]|uniref:SDR family NAD(P)-dependent oxidoreductase n=1 Tax=Jeotgalibacillus haloalkalitolerans TaxID=3104292 RepID=A0ABU5KQY5_9BACL|nr:SDR family NAD(P)-dependent oxidoreductase [Jeotgalibacillus sp. HH7-29]MDZ5713191.1 SDR family NAD(P)-dependent oxidoreductase [Jeotgalibacillus sp. HH7-29]